MEKNRGFSSLALIIIAVFILGGGYWLWQKQTVTPPSALPEGEGTPISPSGGGSEGVESWKTYKNDKYGFEFKYPTQLLFFEHRDANSECLSTLLFGDKQEAEKLNKNNVQTYVNLCIAKSITEARKQFYSSVQWEKTVLDNKPVMKGVVGSIDPDPVLLVELATGNVLIIFTPSIPNLFNQIVSTFRFTK